MYSVFLRSYRILDGIYREGARPSVLLDRDSPDGDSALVRAIVLGTVERDTELSYVLSRLADKPPKRSVEIIVKQGLYCLLHMNSVPPYAAVDGSVELAKRLGKGGAAGFVNAVLKRAAAGGAELPPEDGSVLSLSVRHSVPAWIVERYLKDYGEEKTREIISEPRCELTHMRVNTLKYTDKAFETDLIESGAEYVRTEKGFSTKLSSLTKTLFSEGKITYQSCCSICVADALDAREGHSVLDVCAAPGGKAVLLAERVRTGTVTALDVHPHRVRLIESYAKRMGVENIRASVSDGTVYDPSLDSLSDRVLVDAPCSALGVARKYPDVYLNRREEDISVLARTQLSILRNAARYVRPGGLLVYSTCSLLREENEDVLDAFERNGPLVPDEMEEYGSARKRFFPKGETDGFFIARYRRE